MFKLVEESDERRREGGEEKNQDVVKSGSKKTGWSSDDNLCLPVLQQNVAKKFSRRVLRMNRHLLYPKHVTNILDRNSSAGRIKSSVRPPPAASTTSFPFVFFIIQIFIRCVKTSVRPLMHTAALRDNPGRAVITAGRPDDFI